MASKTTLNAKNLEALGAKRLAELLIEISTGNANHIPTIFKIASRIISA
ncbi:hypothetical protein BR10RB9215_C11555 [Brucella sp. 10RB9215]|nr:hypothetical protein BR10RB9215_C11555 [Brucella sp. 10RB9215]